MGHYRKRICSRKKPIETFVYIRLGLGLWIDVDVIYHDYRIYFMRLFEIRNAALILRILLFQFKIVENLIKTN